MSLFEIDTSNDVTYENLAEVPLKNGKPTRSWMKDWTQEQRTEKFFEFCRAYDKREDSLKWLDRFGDPYSVVISDLNGRVAIDWGVYGAPESFVIDKQGIIRYKQIGPFTPEIIRDELLPLLKRLQAS